MPPCTCSRPWASRRCFCTPASKSNLETLRQAVGPLSIYLLTRVLAVAALAWLAWRYVDLGWQDATLVALALLTSSTGFIIDSLDRYGLEPEERFWVTNNAISGELLALAVMFVVLKATDSARTRPGDAGAAGHAGGLAAGAAGAGTLVHSLRRGFGILDADHDRLRRRFRHRQAGRGIPARRISRRPGGAPAGEPRAATGLPRQSALGQTVLVVLPAVLFFRARRACAGRRVEPAGAGHRRRIDGHAGAVTCLLDLGQTPDARHRQRAQQPAGGRGTDAHPDLHTGAGGHPARARRHHRRVVWRPVAVRGPQYPAAVFHAADGIRCRADAARKRRHRRISQPSRRPDFRPPRRPPCAIRR